MQRRSTEVRILQLGFGFLLLHAALRASAVRVPGTQCQTQCGKVQIPYPFGIGVDCSLSEDFNVSCQQVQNGVLKPFIYNFEVLNISLAESTVRVLNYIASYCYNTSAGVMVMRWTWSNLSGSPYRFSNTQNKFTVIGCNTRAYISDSDTTGIQSGCGATCNETSHLTDVTECSGMGCCQTPIPKMMDYFEIDFDEDFNTSKIARFSRCSYAVLTEAASFNFSTAYVTTSKFNDTNDGQAPMVMDWALRNGTPSCEVATRNETGTYACLSRNSMCVNSTNGPGYVCSCSYGYEGNPYLPDGCKDINECNDNPCPSGVACHNTEAGYRCSCGAGRKFSEQSYTCNLDSTGLIIGLTVSFLVLMIFVFSGNMILQKRKLNRIKEEYFRQHGGMIVLERMKSERGLAFTVFSEAELIEATDNYDKSRIIGKGGHGTVYKGIVKDTMAIAIKKCSLINERQKKEFGQEMLILSQINHKNIVKLVGCCLEVEVPMLVYEFVPNGTLFDLIHGKNQALQITFSTLLRIAHEAAEGLYFLHSYASPPILHGDVKSANILLDHNYMAKVSDFGASILAPSDEEQYVTMVQGTCGYLDPEYMQTCQLTDKSDVYSFGVILLEVLTGQLPLKLDGPETQRSLSSNFLSAMKVNNLDALLWSNIMGQESNELIRGLAELAKQCLDICGVNRPTMKEVAEELGRLRKLSLHPWVQVTETESESLLDSASTTGFEIDVSTTGYPMQEGEKMPMNPRSLYYAR